MLIFSVEGILLLHFLDGLHPQTLTFFLTISLILGINSNVSTFTVFSYRNSVTLSVFSYRNSATLSAPHIIPSTCCLYLDKLSASPSINFWGTTANPSVCSLVAFYIEAWNVSSVQEGPERRRHKHAGIRCQYRRDTQYPRFSAAAGQPLDLWWHVDSRQRQPQTYSLSTKPWTHVSGWRSRVEVK